MTNARALQPIAEENPPFWPEEYPPGDTEHEIYETRPIPPEPYDTVQEHDASPFVGHWMAWMPRGAPQAVELLADKYNPDDAADPRRKLTYQGFYNEVAPSQAPFTSEPDPGWWYPTAHGLYVYLVHSHAWNLSVGSFKDGKPEVLAGPAPSYGRPGAPVWRRLESAPNPVETVELSPATPPTIQAGQSVQVALTATHKDGTKVDVTSRATWESADTTKVTVSGGKITGVAATAEGTPVTVTAAYGGKNTTVDVTVTA